jgi:2-phospho-L-lactate guanylyltransferase
VVTEWSVIIPLKPLHMAKSRLLLPADVRQALVIAMALDVMEAVLGLPHVRQVVLVSRDPRWQALFDDPRISVVPDSPRDSINDALRRGAAACQWEWPGTGIAALTGDLPALSSGDLAEALAQASQSGSSFAPDADGEGTTLLAARCASRFDPRYGRGSRLRHRHAGATELEVPPDSGLRQDVDTLEDLAVAAAIGVGRHTSAVLRRSRLGDDPITRDRRDSAPRARVAQFDGGRHPARSGSMPRPHVVLRHVEGTASA